MKHMLTVLVLCISTTLFAQAPSDARCRIGVFGGIGYGFTNYTSTFTISHDPRTQSVFSFKDTTLQQNGFSGTGISLGSAIEIPLTESATSWFRLVGNYQNIVVQKTTEIKYNSEGTLIDGKIVNIDVHSQASTLFQYSTVSLAALYCQRVFSSSLRFSVGINIGTYLSQHPIEQTFKVVEPNFFRYPINIDSIWDERNDWQEFYNKKLSAQTSSIQIGGVVGVDYSFTFNKFFALPFVQYTMIFTGLTTETPLKLHTIRAGVEFGMYL